MTPEAGDWVAEHILPRHVIDGAGGLDLLRTCACQYGPSGYCSQGQHGRCAHLTQPEWYERPSPDTHVTSRGGRPVAWVWTGCRWRCPCDCHSPAGLWATSDGEQPSLFAAVTA